ncbi:uncharacterized protein BT62DRAFT_1001275 [Guyanagaster necrorhizus]|uniref:N-acetyltransferase domain-containing protein n=1 Tax=Guyanagaster necrorhizus TaxID=856835 RepID=A0A9P8AWD2_9AGAR|nr:uncharacterized protein BT62DRAFT_1001275 [Guyanagaster necrorhizus MCA 3950]KAG7450453.1 hypothetical protein BT62DRAFT_1001275 [Guyanagaster necrorhizus MCA 3950]
MVEPTARIRPFKAEDEKLAKFTIAKANMEGLTTANTKSWLHPLTISIWVALSCIWIEYMQWWPNAHHGYVSCLKPLPAFACIAVPILALADWINRPHFEKVLQTILRKPDMHDLAGYYSRTPASGFWLLEYGDSFVGLIAVDASLDHNSNPDAKKKQSPSTAVITHFSVDEKYRSTGVQDDLLAHAVRHAFTSSPTIQRIEGIDSPLVKFTGPCYTVAGFKIDLVLEPIGTFKWRPRKRVLERSEWEKRAQ